MANPKKNGSATPILCFFIRGSFSNRKKGLLSQLAPTPPHLKPVKPWVKSTSSWLGKNPSRHSEGTTLDNNDNICMIIIGCWLVVWNIWFIFPYIYIYILLGIIIPTDSYFSEGLVYHQPVLVGMSSKIRRC